MYMKRTGIWIAAILLMMALICTGCTSKEPEILGKGSCGAEGDNVTWTLDDTGRLSITGTGEMHDYFDQVKVPWNGSNNLVEKVSISDGITRIGRQAFKECEKLTEIVIPEGVTSIGKGAFSGCDALKKVTIPESVTRIEEHAFYWCENLKELKVPDSVTYIGYGAFPEHTQLICKKDSAADLWSRDNGRNVRYVD